MGSKQALEFFRRYIGRKVLSAPTKPSLPATSPSSSYCREKQKAVKAELDMLERRSIGRFMYGKTFSAPSMPLSARSSQSLRSYCNGPSPLAPGLPSSPSGGYRFVLRSVGVAAVLWLINRSYPDCREMYANWKAEKKIRQIQDILDRKKSESPEAYLEMIDRKIKALKPELSTSLKDDPLPWEVNNQEREVALLKKMSYAWAQEMGIVLPKGRDGKLAG